VLFGKALWSGFLIKSDNVCHIKNLYLWMLNIQYIYNHLSQPLDIFTIGTATCRFNSLLYINNKIFVPVTTSIAIYEDM
jgi:hypothetical protein